MSTRTIFVSKPDKVGLLSLLLVVLNTVTITALFYIDTIIPHYIAGIGMLLSSGLVWYSGGGLVFCWIAACGGPWGILSSFILDYGSMDQILSGLPSIMFFFFITGALFSIPVGSLGAIIVEGSSILSVNSGRLRATSAKERLLVVSACVGLVSYIYYLANITVFFIPIGIS
jgi:hypothetical protein